MRQQLQPERKLILRLWQKDLSQEEQRAIKAADSEQSLWAASLFAHYPRRVRFRVVEWLEGGNAPEFDVYTEFTSCGYKFNLGETYLVVASAQSSDARWWTGACMRNQPVVSATQDLRLCGLGRQGVPLVGAYTARFWTGRRQAITNLCPTCRCCLFEVMLG